MVSIILFGCFLIFLLLSVPIAISLGLASLLALFYSGAVSNTFVPQSLVTSIDSFPLMAVPFFILAGDLMGHGGLSKRLLDVAAVFFGRFTGGLAIVGIVTCMFFAAISGSGPATVAAIGGILFPAMARANYDKGWSAGLVASAGSIGIIIPPSIPMIIYGVSANVSISQMFVAGVIPGLIVGVFLIVTAWIQAKSRGYAGDAKTYDPKEAMRVVWDAKWALAAPVIILGGIYGGVFTPTEAAAVGVLYGFFVGLFVYKDLKISELHKIILGSALTSATIILIIATATIFARVLTIERIPVAIAEYIVQLTSNEIIILMLMNILLLFVGAFMDTISAIIILTPILLPIIIAAGIDPVHFGIIMVVNLAIGMVTPPVGVNLFVAARIGKTTLEKTAVGAAPFLVAMLLSLLVITYMPDLSLWLVELIYK